LGLAGKNMFPLNLTKTKGGAGGTAHSKKG